MKSIQVVCMVFIFINSYMFSDSDVDPDNIDLADLSKDKTTHNQASSIEIKRPQPDIEFLYYKPPQTTTTITTTTKARKRQKSHNEQINSDNDVIEIKRPDVEIIYYKSPLPPTTTTPDVFKIIPDRPIIFKNKSTTTTKICKYSFKYTRASNIEEFLEAFEALPNRTNNRYNINKQILEQYNFRVGVTNSIVFNCKTPSIMGMARRKESIKNIHILGQLKKKAVCNRFTPNGTIDENSVWLKNGKFDSPVIYTIMNRPASKDKGEFLFGLPYSVSYLIDYFIEFDLCELFLEYLGHPYYYSYSPIKPTLCDKKVISSI